MKKVLSRVQAFLWTEGIPRTYTTNCHVWEDHLVRDNGYVYFDDIDYAQQDVAFWDALNHINSKFAISFFRSTNCGIRNVTELGQLVD